MDHRFPFSVNWTGSTLDPAFSRSAELRAEGHPALPVSSAPAFSGDPARWNPEELLGGALATCHMLTFLALAAKARLEVKAYEGAADIRMAPLQGNILHLPEIALRPVIRVAPGTSMAKVVELFEKAHKYCIVANSIKCEVRMEPRIVEG